MLEEEKLKKLASGCFKTYDCEKLNLNQDLATSHLLNELREDFNSLNNADTKETRCRHFAIEGSNPEDYSEHIFDSKEFGVIGAGIRHFGGDGSRPFVLLQSEFPCLSEKAGRALFDEFSSYFKVFKPKHFCLYSPTDMTPALRGATLFAGNGGDIQSIPEWEGERDLHFSDPDSENYYKWYESEYELFHKECPELKSSVPVNSKAEMEESREQGLLKMISIDSYVLGLIAAENSDLLGHNGVYFNEIYITSAFRGKGLAKAIQRKFIAKYGKSDDIFWGTIDEGNLSSKATAIRNGRMPIRYENFFTT